MATYRFRVTFEEHEDVYREIDIKVNQNYDDFHKAIQEAIGFDNSKPASFFMSDDYWRKGMEIASEVKKKSADEDEDDLPRNRKVIPARLMSKTKIAETIEDPHQKIIYIFDPEAMWTLMIELIKIGTEEGKAIYPKCVKTVGLAPKQYKVTTLPPPVEEDDELEEDEKNKKEKVFHAEEAYDKEGDEDEDVLTEGDPAEEAGESEAEEGAPEEGFEPDEGVVD